MVDRILRRAASPEQGLSRFAFALGTFHAAMLVVVGVMLAYRQGNLSAVGDLNTAFGLGAFGLLWWASVYGTRWALLGVRDHSLEVALRRGILGGMRAGLAVVVLLVAVFVLTLPFVMVAGGVLDVLTTGVFIAAFYGVFGALGALVIGGALGFVLGLLDWVILALAGIGNGFSPEDEAATGG